MSETSGSVAASRFVDQYLLEDDLSLLMQVDEDQQVYPGLWEQLSRPLQPLSNWPPRERGLPCSLDACCQYIFELIRAYEEAYDLHSIWYECRSILDMIRRRGEPAPWFALLCRALEVGARREGVEISPCRLETMETSPYWLKAEIWRRWNNWHANGYCWNRQERLQARRWLEYLKTAIEAKQGCGPAITIEAATIPEPPPQVDQQSTTTVVESPAISVDLQNLTFTFPGGVIQLYGEQGCELLSVYAEFPDVWLRPGDIKKRAREKNLGIQECDLQSLKNIRTQIKKYLGNEAIESDNHRGSRLVVSKIKIME